MAETTMGARAGISPRKFYMAMAWTCLAVAVLGFMPTYFLPLAQSKFDAPVIVHIHGLVMFSWVAFFVVQASLVSSGNVLAHRTWGVAGVSIITAMVFIVTAVVSMRVRQVSQPGVPADITEGTKAFSWVTIGTLVLVVPMFITAIANIKKPEIHKRLILLITVAMLAAPIARWFLTFLAPPPDPNAPPLPAGVVPAPPVQVAIAPALVGDIILLIAMTYDWRTRGRPHPVYLIGGAILLIQQLTVVQVGHSALWQAVATWIGKMAG
ncbi:MAG: hypothetical protein ACXU8S_15365 [Phenylobacterium sp.]